LLNFFLCISCIAHKYEKSALTGGYHNFMKKHEELKLGTHNLLQIHISQSVRVHTSTEMILTHRDQVPIDLPHHIPVPHPR